MEAQIYRKIIKLCSPCSQHCSWWRHKYIQKIIPLSSPCSHSVAEAKNLYIFWMHVPTICHLILDNHSQMPTKLWQATLGNLNNQYHRSSNNRYVHRTQQIDYHSNSSKVYTTNYSDFFLQFSFKQQYQLHYPF